MTKTEINKFINFVKWQFAKTMPEIPHEYIFTDRYPKKAEEISAFIKQINTNGYAKTFYSKEYKYLVIDDYRYWVIENIINRAKIKS